MVNKRIRSALNVLSASVLALAPALPAAAAVYPLPAEDQHVIGEVQTVTAAEEDTFVSLARRYGVGYEELLRANPQVDPWLPGEGTRVLIPTRFVLPDAPRTGIVLNVPEMRLYYYPAATAGADAEVYTYPVSIGRMDWKTPLGRTSIVSRQRDPAWRPPASIRQERLDQGREALPAIVPAGPDNPLGAHALRLGVPGYLIHGTNKPAGVGMRVTHGCIRMFPEDIAALFEQVRVGEQVRLVNQPFKIGWEQERLLLEVHPALEEDVNAERKNRTTLTQVLVARTDARRSDIDWDAMHRIYDKASGIPMSMQLPPALPMTSGCGAPDCDAAVELPPGSLRLERALGLEAVPDGVR